MAAVTIPRWPNGAAAVTMADGDRSVRVLLVPDGNAQQVHLFHPGGSRFVGWVALVTRRDRTGRAREGWRALTDVDGPEAGAFRDRDEAIRYLLGHASTRPC